MIIEALTAIGSAVCFIIGALLIFAILLITIKNQLIDIAAARRELQATKDKQDLINLFTDIYYWCNYEFPEMGHLALELKKHYERTDHAAFSIDGFRNDCRRRSRELSVTTKHERFFVDIPADVESADDMRILLEELAYSIRADHFNLSVIGKRHHAPIGIKLGFANDRQR